MIKGQLRMEFRDRIEVVNPGEIIVIPKGVEHRPCAEEETWILLFEPLAPNIQEKLSLILQNQSILEFNFYLKLRG